MKTYVKKINGKSIYKNRSQIIIVKEDSTVYNPTEELIFNDGWIEYIPENNTLEDIRNSKIRQITEYDQSDDVNIFYVGDIPIWLDKATRAGLMLRFSAELENAKTETTLWYNGMKFPLNLDAAVKMLYAIEVYASACYDNTQRHLAEVNKLTTEDEINSYDFKAGYPEKLRF